MQQFKFSGMNAIMEKYFKEFYWIHFQYAQKIKLNFVPELFSGAVSIYDRKHIQTTTILNVSVSADAVRIIPILFFKLFLIAFNAILAKMFRKRSTWSWKQFWSAEVKLWNITACTPLTSSCCNGMDGFQKPQNDQVLKHGPCLWQHLYPTER